MLEHGRQPQCIERRNCRGDITHHHADLPALQVHIHPKTVGLPCLEGQITFKTRLEFLDLGRAHDRIGLRTHILRRKRNGTDGGENTLPLDGRRGSGCQKQVGGPFVHHLCKA